jgi:ribosomal protein S18 acetylase RimI-like enzyme
LSQLLIRPANSDDLDAILNLYGELEKGNRLALSAADFIFKKLGRYPNYKIYVAVIEGKTIGTFSLLIMDNLAHMGMPSGIVENVVVHSEWRRRGIARQMMAFAMELSRKARCYKLVLSSDLNREVAHRFYEAIGFERHGYSYMVRWDQE